MSFKSQKFMKQLRKLSCTQPERDGGEAEETPVKCKVLTMGDGFVGKTSLLTRFVTDRFSEDYEATIFENLARPVMVGRKKVMLHLFDTAGQEIYEQLRRSMYYDTDIVLLCFAIDSHQSLTNIQEIWQPELMRTCLKKVPVLLIGLKTDLRPKDLPPNGNLTSPEPEPEPELTVPHVQETKRRTPSDIANGNAVGSGDAVTTGEDAEEQSFSSYSQGQEMANLIGARAYFECSSKLNEGLTAIFDQAARIHERRQRGSLSFSSLRNRLSSRTSLSAMN